MAASESTLPPTSRKPAPLVLTAGSLKVTLVLDPEELATVPPPTGTGPVPFIAAAGGRFVGGTLNPKTVRRVLKTLSEHGPAQVAVVLQGKLETDDMIAEAGITALPRTPKEGSSND